MVADIQEADMSRFNDPVQIELVEQTGERYDVILRALDADIYSNFDKDELFKGLLKFAPYYYFDVTWQQQDVVKESLPSYFTSNFKSLESAFNNELKKYSDYLIHDADYSRKIFERIALLISELPFISGTIELTMKKGFKFTLLFPRNKLLMISKSLSPEKSQNLNDEIIYSLFFNRQLIDFDEINLAENKEGFKKYLSV